MPPSLVKMFGVAKPVIAMAHLPALPGTPRHDAAAGVAGIVERVRADLRHLLAGGVDAVMFCNEDDRPYVFRADPASVAVMARVITELRPTDRPFGTDFLWDPVAALALAKATGAAFMREVVTGAYESDMGLWTPDAGALLRYRTQIGADEVAIFANITPEFASPLGSRSVRQRARSAVVSSLVDAILVSGAMAGAEPDLKDLREAKEAVGESTPVLVNTGARRDNIAGFLAVADGVIVGSSLKVDGQTWNPVDPARVAAFMAEVKRVRRA
jgi:membrane complex biogenesis BtpA family protein